MMTFFNIIGLIIIKTSKIDHHNCTYSNDNINNDNDNNENDNDNNDFYYRYYSCRYRHNYSFCYQ